MVFHCVKKTSRNKNNKHKNIVEETNKKTAIYIYIRIYLYTKLYISIQNNS